MGRADLHIHTSEGDGLDSIETILAHTEERTGLDIIAITEHDDLDVALRAREVAARGGYRVQVVPGVEITTLEGHLIALFIEKPVTSFRRIEASIEAVLQQGGVCFVPHPGSWLTRSVSASTLDRLAASGSLPQALELANSSPASRLTLAAARRWNAGQYRLPGVGASDAHYREAIGSSFTEFEGTSTADLRDAFKTGLLSEATTSGGPVGALRRLRILALPVAGLRATPRKLGWRRTAWSFVRRYET